MWHLDLTAYKVVNIVALAQKNTSPLKEEPRLVHSEASRRASGQGETIHVVKAV